MRPLAWDMNIGFVQFFLTRLSRSCRIKKKKFLIPSRFIWLIYFRGIFNLIWLCQCHLLYQWWILLPLLFFAFPAMKTQLYVSCLLSCGMFIKVWRWSIIHFSALCSPSLPFSWIKWRFSKFISLCSMIYWNSFPYFRFKNIFLPGHFYDVMIFFVNLRNPFYYLHELEKFFLSFCWEDIKKI